MDEDQLETLRRWGDGLQGDAREEVHAAGRAITLLCAEVERLERELWDARTSLVDDSPPGGEHDDEPLEQSLRKRLQRALRGLPGNVL